jgi:hypothetical protein
MSNPFDLLDLGTESDEEPRSRTGSVNITRGRSFSLEDCTGSTAQIVIDAAQDDDEDDGWETVKPSPGKSGPGRTEEEMMSASPAYSSFDWQAGDDTAADDRDQAKSGAGSAGKGKHSLTFNATLSRNHSIEKRDAQRGYAKR